MTNRWFSIAALLTSLSLVIIGCAGPSPTPTLSRLVSERLIAQGDYSSVTVSPDCRHVAGVGETKSKSFFVVDGIKGKEYDRMELGKLFSPDGQRVAYAAEEGDKWFVVVDGLEYGNVVEFKSPSGAVVPEVYSNFATSLPVFSPDSKRWAYVETQDDKSCAVVDGIAGKKYSDVNETWGDFPRDIVFSPDSKHVAYVANRRFVVLDGVEGKQYQYVDIFKFRFSPDSKRIAYVAEEGDKWFVVVDGVEGEKYDAFSSQGPVFSPDSKHIAYTVQEGDKWFAVVDGIEDKKYDSVNSITFSPDSKRVAYMAQEGHKQFVVVDGVEGKKYGSIYSLTFSPDSKYLAYQARRSGKWCVVVDRVEGKLYDDGKLSLPTVVFDSPDTLHYIAQKGNAFYLVEETIQEITAK